MVTYSYHLITYMYLNNVKSIQMVVRDEPKGSQ